MDLKELLFKRALGFEVEEVSEEYSDVDGKLVLSKKKVTKKYIPPDAVALKFLLTNQFDDDNNASLSQLSYNELLAIKDDLLNEINNLTQN